MEMGLSWGTRPEFISDETVRFSKARVWLASAKSPPTYRISVSVPPLLSLAVYVTDRRILFVAQFLLLFKQQFSVWYKFHAEEDVLQAISVSVGTFPYVEIISEAPTTPWFRSPQCRMRLYMRNPSEFQCAVGARALDDAPS